MNLLARTTQALDNLANPILVKEVRQAVKGSFLVFVIGLILVGQLVTWWFMTAVFRDSNVSGMVAFLWMLGLFGVSLGITMPIYTGWRILSERARKDLFYVSALSPFQIIWGKFLSSGFIILVVLSTFLPFFYLTLMLGEIDILTITYSVVIVVATLLVGVMLTICLLCPVVPMLVRGFLILTTLTALGYLSALSVLSLASVIIPDDFFYMMPADTWFVSLVIAIAWILGSGAAIVYLTSLSSCMIAPPSSNRCMVPRILTTAICFLFPLITFGMIIATSAQDMNEIATGFLAMLGYTLIQIGLFALLVSANGRFRYGLRLAKSIPRDPIRRILAFPWISGCANGVCWSLLMILTGGILVFGVVGAVLNTGMYDSPMAYGIWDNNSPFSFYRQLSFFNYVCIYVWIGMLLSKMTEKYLPIAWTIIFAGGVGVVVSIVFFMDEDAGESAAGLLMNWNLFSWYEHDVYMRAFGSSIANLTFFSVVLLTILGPQTRSYFSASPANNSQGGKPPESPGGSSDAVPIAKPVKVAHPPAASESDA